MASKTEYDPRHALGRRLREPADPLMDDQRRDAPKGLSQFDAVYWFDRAHLVMLVERELVPRDVGLRCLSLLCGATREQLEHIAKPPAENFFGETLLIRELGLRDGGWLPLGRSTHDMNGVVWRLRLRDRVLSILAANNDLRAAVLDLADQHVRTVMPHFTHRVEGQLATLAHALHSHVCAAERDHRRMAAAYDTINTSSAGAAAGVGTPFRLDRERTAELLGFSSVSANTRDAIWHDGVFEAGTAQSIMVAAMANHGEDYFQWHRSGFIEIGDRFCRSSSLMPGKRSVTAIEEFAQLLHARLNGRSPVSYPVWYWGELLDQLEKTQWVNEVLAGITRTISIDAGAMRAHLDTYWAHGVDIAGWLVRNAGLSWRCAHQVTAVLVVSMEDAGRKPTELTADDVKKAAAAVLDGPLEADLSDFGAAVDPDRCIEEYDVVGGLAPARVEKALADSRARLEDDKRAVAKRKTAIETSLKKLEDATAKLLGK